MPTRFRIFYQGRFFQINLFFRRAGRGYPDWKNILGKETALWRKAFHAARNGPPVLMATGVGGDGNAMVVESVLAVALTLRGARVHVALCDEALPACFQTRLANFESQATFAAEGPPRALCRSCFVPAQAVYHSLGLPVHRYRKYLTRSDVQKAGRLAASAPLAGIEGYCVDGVAVGEHALANTLFFYGRGDLEGEPEAGRILRRYLKASLFTLFAMQRLLDSHSFESLCLHYGIYVPQGIVGEVARRKGLQAVVWNVTYRRQCFVFCHGRSFHQTLLEEPTSYWEDVPWTGEKQKRLSDCLESRRKGLYGDWLWLHRKPQEDPSAIIRELGIDRTKPCIGMLPNVTWDPKLSHPANAFPGMLDWVLETIRYFLKRPELQLVIRIHPGEAEDPKRLRQPLAAEIRRAFPTLPSHIFVVSPESPINTYALMDLCNAVLFYGSITSGVELSCQGIPIVVVGDAIIRNKGIALEASSPEGYFQILNRLPLAGSPDEGQIQKARRYAYHFFFRRMIPIACLQPTDGSSAAYRLHIESLSDLLPGRDSGLDLVCRGILEGEEFIYD